MPSRQSPTHRPPPPDLHMPVATPASAAPNPPAASPPRADPPTFYLYHDEQGRPLYRLARLAQPQGVRICYERPDRADPTRWLPVTLPLLSAPYLLPELLASTPATPVFITPDEPCADALVAQGHLATCSPGAEWLDVYNDYLLDRTLIILPANHAPGRDYAEQIAAAVATVAATVKVVLLPGLPERGNVADWYRAGHHDGELQALIAAAPPWTPSPTASSPLSLQACARFAQIAARDSLLNGPHQWRRFIRALACALAERGLPTATVHQLLLATARALHHSAPEWRTAAVAAATRGPSALPDAGFQDPVRLVGEQSAMELLAQVTPLTGAAAPWPTPIPLTTVERVPFPLDVLPEPSRSLPLQPAPEPPGHARRRPSYHGPRRARTLRAPGPRAPRPAARHPCPGRPSSRTPFSCSTPGPYPTSIAAWPGPTCRPCDRGPPWRRPERRHSCRSSRLQPERSLP